jgi:hypothetical protein
MIHLLASWLACQGRLLLSCGERLPTRAPRRSPLRICLPRGYFFDAFVLRTGWFRMVLGRLVGRFTCERFPWRRGVACARFQCSLHAHDAQGDGEHQGSDDDCHGEFPHSIANTNTCPRKSLLDIQLTQNCGLDCPSGRTYFWQITACRSDSRSYTEGGSAVK